ncbi:hypothetical protein ACLKA7_013657 [Drosophila subpalustris]
MTSTSTSLVASLLQLSRCRFAKGACVGRQLELELDWANSQEKSKAALDPERAANGREGGGQQQCNKHCNCLIIGVATRRVNCNCNNSSSNNNSNNISSNSNISMWHAACDVKAGSRQMSAQLLLQPAAHNEGCDDGADAMQMKCCKMPGAATGAASCISKCQRTTRTILITAT